MGRQITYMLNQQVQLVIHWLLSLQIYSEVEIAETTRENLLSVLIIDKKKTMGQCYYFETLSFVFPDPGNPKTPETPMKNGIVFAFKKFAAFQLISWAAYFFMNKNFEIWMKKGMIITI